MSVKCPECHSENPDTNTFCGDCGTNLGPFKDFPEVTKTIKTPSSQLKPGDLLDDRYKVVGALDRGAWERSTGPETATYLNRFLMR